MRNFFLQIVTATIFSLLVACNDKPEISQTMHIGSLRLQVTPCSELLPVSAANMAENAAKALMKFRPANGDDSWVALLFIAAWSEDRDEFDGELNLVAPSGTRIAIDPNDIFPLLGKPDRLFAGQNPIGYAL